MHRIARAVLVLSALLVLPLTAKNAYAGPITEQFKLSWSGAYGTGSAILTGVELSNDIFLITGLSGTQSGNITLLNPNSYGGNDNKFYTASPQTVDGAGIGFEVGSADFNIYFNPGTTFYECTSTATNCLAAGSGSALTSFGFTPLSLPEPSSFMILSSGLIAFIGVVRRKRLV